MAYDKEKAHEYYEKYRKKGLLKGRKKSTTKKTTKKKGRKTKGKQESLVGLNTSGLNDAGKMQASMIKDKIKTEMNAALAKEKDPVKRAAIKQEYQNKALSELTALKNKSEYAKAKTTSAKSGGSKGSKASSGGGKGGSSGGSSGSKGESSSKSSSSKGNNATTTRTSSTNATQKAINEANATIKALQQVVSNMSDDERKAAKQAVTRIYNQIRSEYSKLKTLKKGGSVS